MASIDKTNTQHTDNDSDQIKDSFQEAFPGLIENYFEPEETEEKRTWTGLSPVHLTPQELEELGKEWSEHNRRQAALAWGNDYVAQS